MDNQCLVEPMIKREPIFFGKPDPLLKMEVDLRQKEAMSYKLILESQNQLIEQQKESLRAKETEIMKLQNALKDAQRHAGHIVGTSNIR